MYVGHFSGAGPQISSLVRGTGDKCGGVRASSRASSNCVLPYRSKQLLNRTARVNVIAEAAKPLRTPTPHDISQNSPTGHLIDSTSRSRTYQLLAPTPWKPATTSLFNSCHDWTKQFDSIMLGSLYPGDREIRHSRECSPRDYTAPRRTLAALRLRCIYIALPKQEAIGAAR